MIWPQKLYAVALHSQAPGRVGSLVASDFVVPEGDIAGADEYQKCIHHMDYVSAQYRARNKSGLIPHTHYRMTSTIIMKGAVIERKGMLFQRENVVWSCKLPDRGLFRNWLNCKTKSANHETQKFIMFYLAHVGKVRLDYTDYPFDDFMFINDADELAEFLNRL